MAFCRNCGKEVSGDMEFCPGCGRQLAIGQEVKEKELIIHRPDENLTEKVTKMSNKNDKFVERIEGMNKKVAAFDEWYHRHHLLKIGFIMLAVGFVLFALVLLITC